MQKLAITGIIVFLVIGSSNLVYAANLNYPFIDINNNSRNLEEFKGKPLLVDAFATWCEPCKIEMEHLKVIYSKSKDKLNIVSLSVSPKSDTVNLVKDFRNDFDALWEFGIDMDSKFSNSFKVIYIPSLYLLDSDGELVKVWEGITDPQDIAKELKDKLDIELGEVDFNADDVVKDQLSRNNMFQLTSAFLILIVMYNILVPKFPVVKKSEPVT